MRPSSRRTLSVFMALAALVGASVWAGKPGGSAESWFTGRRPSPDTGEVRGHGVVLNPRFDRTRVVPGTGRPLYLAAGLEVVGGERPDRRPLALAMVLDVSGSMRGERKLEHVVEATQYVLDRLGKEDRVAIVAYDSDRHEVYLPEGRVDPAAAKRELAKLRPGSGTNMEIGLRLGLAKLSDLGGKDHVKRVLLLSDGQANEGIHTIEGLSKIAASSREVGASVSTFGVGADYNEDLMAALAEAAGGNYYVIDRGAELAEVFRKEFDELGSTMGTQVVLEVRPSSLLRLEEVFGYPVEEKDGVHRVTLRDLFHGQQTKVMLELSAIEGKRTEAAAVDLRLTWVDAATGERRALAARPEIRWTESEEEERASIVPEVLELAQEVESARVLDRASREYERGNREAAQALLKEQMERNRAVSEGYLGGDAKRLETQNELFEDAIDRFDEAPASSRSGKAAVKFLKQGARQSAY